jgi:precorrin-6Y C5,15-methyltransferase (decarboxylating)
VITVIGYDGSPVRQELLAGATLVVGGQRHLDAADLPAGARTIVMGDVRAAVAALLEHDGDAVVLASGDPGFFGIVRRLRAAGARMEVHPAVSSVALAFARIGVEWDDAQVVSAHGRDPRRALAAVRRGGKVAVLTDARTGPREVALAAPADACIVVAERLGEAAERVVRGTPEQIAAGTWAEPNVVLVLDGQPPADPPWQIGRAPGGGAWALPESAFEHRDGMVTKAEVRALALARLAPAPGTLIWDVGAGSGSVAVECSRLGAAVFAVESSAEDCGRIAANARTHQAPVEVVHGHAPEVLAGLPDPDAVFVGGGGPDVVRAVAARRPARVVVALAQLERVAPTVEALSGFATESVLLQAARLQPLGGGTRLAPANPVFVVSGVLL